jgi:hypothetical protein
MENQHSLMRKKFKLYQQEKQEQEEKKINDRNQRITALTDAFKEIIETWLTKDQSHYQVIKEAEIALDAALLAFDDPKYKVDCQKLKGGALKYRFTVVKKV